MYKRMVRPTLFTLFKKDPEKAHEWVNSLFRFSGNLPWFTEAVAHLMTVQDPADLLGIHFPNRVGLAAGFAKDAKTLWGLRMLGFGFIEMGTITARAQPGNPRPRIWRLPQDRALINAVGFHNNGADRAAYTVKCSGKPPIPIGISIGKSAAIPAENTEVVIRDLLRSIYTLGPYGDYFVLNVSSPNTPGLRGLQSAEQLSPIVRSCKTALGKKPLLIKIAPDLTNEALDDVLQTCTDQGVGLVATNTMPTPARQHERKTSPRKLITDRAICTKARAQSRHCWSWRHCIH